MSITVYNIFLDCEDGLCDSDYFRTEIPWVNWVRQRQDADVHLIVTSEETGGGGLVCRIDLMGTADAAYEDQLLHTAQSTDTDRETLDGIAHTIGTGLLRFASESGFGQLVEFVEKGSPEADPAERVVSGTEVDDPWNFWVFSLRSTPRITGEKTRRAVDWRMPRMSVRPVSSTAGRTLPRTIAPEPLISASQSLGR